MPEADLSSNGYIDAPMEDVLDEEPVRGLGQRLLDVVLVPVRLLEALLLPDRGVARQVASARYGAAMLAVTLCALAQSAAIGLRLDVAPAVLKHAAEAARPKPGDAPGQAPETKSDREVQDEIMKTLAVRRVMGALGAGLGTPAMIFVLGLVAYLLMRYVGGKPTMPRALAAASIAWLPQAVHSLVVAAAVLAQPAVTPEQIGTLVPNPLAAGLASHAVLSRLLAGVDPFFLWSVLLLAFGTAAAGEMSKRRAFIATIVCTILYLAIGNLVMSHPGPTPGMGQPS
jgi:hypothetical protein